MATQQQDCKILLQSSNAAVTGSDDFADDDMFSVMDKYDLKANEFRQYFPQPEAGKSEEQELDEQRRKLGLLKTKSKRNTSLHEEDDEPRYEISLLEGLAQSDLMVTNWDNQSEEDRQYGDGVAIGKEIDEAIKI